MNYCSLVLSAQTIEQLPDPSLKDGQHHHSTVFSNEVSQTGHFQHQHFVTASAKCQDFITLINSIHALLFHGKHLIRCCQESSTVLLNTKHVSLWIVRQKNANIWPIVASHTSLYFCTSHTTFVLCCTAVQNVCLLSKCLLSIFTLAITTADAENYLFGKLHLNWW